MKNLIWKLRVLKDNLIECALLAGFVAVAAGAIRPISQVLTGF
jgi:hypothetical protein